MFKWLMQYLEDWNDLRQENSPIAHRTDSKGGGYFWGTQKDSKAALVSIRKQLRSQNFRCQRARFGGIYIPDRAMAHEVYEALMHQGGYVISNYCRLGGDGPRMTMIDT